MTNQHLIPVTKDGDYLEVHPTTLADHQRVGWAKCARQEAVSPAATDPDANGDGKVTAAELRAALTDAGIAFKANASKADLQALYDAEK